MWYVAVFVVCLLVDLVPVIGPPAWIGIVFFTVKFDLNIWLALSVGVAGSAIGRYLMSLYIPKLSAKVLKRQKREDLEFLGQKLGHSLWKSWTFTIVYTLTPLPTTPLFTAAGMAHIHPLRLVPPFVIAKWISDAMMVWTGKVAVSSFSDMLHGTFSIKGIVIIVISLLLIAALLFVDWRALLQQKKLRFHLHVWK